MNAGTVEMWPPLKHFSSSNIYFVASRYYVE